MAALKLLAKPADTMIDAAHGAVWSDGFWAINSRRDFQKVVRAMIVAAVAESERAEPKDRLLGRLRSFGRRGPTIERWRCRRRAPPSAMATTVEIAPPSPVGITSARGSNDTVPASARGARRPTTTIGTALASATGTPLSAWG